MPKIKHGELVKPQQVKFVELIFGHTFEVVDVDKLPDGEWRKCAFCGQRLRYRISIKRDDGVKVRVGETCLAKGGIVLPPEFKEKLKMLRLPFTKRKPKTTEETYDMDSYLLRMLDDL